MNKRDFDRDFISNIANNLDTYTSSGSLDKPMVRQMYSDTTDSLHKDGVISDSQRFNWCTPKGALNHRNLINIKRYRG